MKKTMWTRWFAAILFVGGLAACSPKDINVGSWQVIPLPQEIMETPEAAPFVINSSTVISYPEGNEKLERTAHFLASYIREVTGTNVKVAAKGGKIRSHCRLMHRFLLKKTDTSCRSRLTGLP